MMHMDNIGTCKSMQTHSLDHGFHFDFTFIISTCLTFFTFPLKQTAFEYELIP